MVSKQKFQYIDPSAQVNLEAYIGDGVYISEFVLVRDATISDGVILKPYAIVSKGCFVGEDTTIGPGAMLLHEDVLGKHKPSKIGKNCYLGAKAVVLPGVSICDNVTIGACALVMNDITESGTYVGVPCHKL